MAAAAKRVWAYGLALSVLLAMDPACAIDFNVTRQDDPVPNGCVPGDCSLREAVLAANAAPSADRVLLPASDQGYALFQLPAGEDLGLGGDLDIVGELEIAGAGAASQSVIVQVTVDRVIHVQPGGRLTLRQVTLQGGRGVVYGGAVFVPSGSLVVRDAAFRLNSALDRGGTLYVRNGGANLSLDVADTHIGESAAPAGGAVFLAGTVGVATHMRFRQVDFVDNEAVQRGGALALDADFAPGSLIEVIDGEFIENEVSATDGRGGAIFNGSPLGATVRVRDSNFFANRAVGSASRGGALFEVQSIERTRFSQNRAAIGGALAGDSADVLEVQACDNLALRNGGAFALHTATIHASTFCRNEVSGTAPGDGGGALFLNDVSSSLAVTRCTFDANVAAVGGAIHQSGGALSLLQSTLVDPVLPPLGSAGTLLRYDGGDGEIVQLTGNLMHGTCSFSEGDFVIDRAFDNVLAPGDTCGFTPAIPSRGNNLVFANREDLLLDTLADNGGPTSTRVPVNDPPHPAVDHMAVANCLFPLDQRGFQSYDGRCDAGALEVGGLPVPTFRLFADGFEDD